MDALRNKAEKYCAQGEHCIDDVRIKLIQWGATNDIIEPIINHLLAHNFINEQRYCNAFVHDKMRHQKWGKKKIIYALQGKRIDANTIENTIKNIDETEYIKTLSTIINKKKGYSHEQITRFCMQRGFEYSLINQQLQALRLADENSID